MGTGPRVIPAVLLFVTGPVFAGQAPVSALDLFEPLRSSAIGGAGVAIGSDSTLAPLNPAAAARVPATALTLGGRQGFFGDLLGHAGLTMPTIRGTWFAGLQYYGTPTVQLRTSNGAMRSVPLQQDMVVAGGYARAIGRSVAWGVTAKVLRSELFGEFHTQAGAVDAGVQARITDHFKAGLAVRNLGPSFRYFEDKVDHRTGIRAGVAGGWNVRSGSAGSPSDTLILAADADWDTTGGTAEVCAGAEYRWAGLVSFRAGACVGGNANTRGPATAGLGFSNGPYRLDYSVRFGTVFSLPHALALTLLF